MSDADLRDLERAAAHGDPVAVERYLVARIRVSSDLTQKLVRRLIRLERVVLEARANEAGYFAPVSSDEFLAFLDRDAPEKPTGPGRFVIEGQDPVAPGGPRGGSVHLLGGRADGSGNEEIVAPPTNAELHAMILALTERVEFLENA